MSFEKLGNTFEVIAVVFPDPDCLADVAENIHEDILTKLLTSTSFKCDCCGSTNLAWPAIIENEIGKQFIVGTKCASNAVKGINPHKIADLKHAAVRVQRDHFLANEEFTTWLKGLPHPKGWNGKSRFDNVRHWVMRKLPKMAVIRKAWREFGKAQKAGLISPDGIQHSAEWATLATFHADHETALKGAAHHLAAKKRWAKKKSCADFIEWALDAKTTDADALTRALAIAKHSLGLGPSLEEIASQKAAADAVAAKALKAIGSHRIDRWASVAAVLIEAESWGAMAILADGSLTDAEAASAVHPRQISAGEGIVVRRCSDCDLAFATSEERSEHEDEQH